jgi:TM2 domain-containing membrane protein YozV
MSNKMIAPNQVIARQKNPGLAVLLSFFWCGLGQIYNGEIPKGVVLMVLYTPCVWFGITSTFAGLLAYIGGDMADQQNAAGGSPLLIGLVSLFLGGFLSLYAIVNAYRKAGAINKRLVGAL